VAGGAGNAEEELATSGFLLLLGPMLWISCGRNLRKQFCSYFKNHQPVPYPDSISRPDLKCT
jgi:hypothetical protein